MNSPGMIDISFPVMALSVNIILMMIRNFVFEIRQRKVTRKINSKVIQMLYITRKFKKFVPTTWAECKPGHIIKVKNGQEFPADCLILDIQGIGG
jgi:magnesium-transporting ATPase (P-type)